MSDVREIFLRAIARADELTAASVLHPATLPFRTLMYPLWLCAVAWQVPAVNCLLDLSRWFGGPT
jgi:hypothetical protein